MGCFFSRRRKPAQGGQLPLQQQAGAGQDAATGEQKAPQYSWDLRAKVPPRRLRDGAGAAGWEWGWMELSVSPLSVGSVPLSPAVRVLCSGREHAFPGPAVAAGSTQFSAFI